jgi:hypothetical protein
MATDEERLWTFPEGSVGHSDSVKGYRVEASDGHLGDCAWADYKPGESYVVVSVAHGEHHLVPAGAIAAVDHDARTVTLKVTVAEVKASPTHEDPQTAYDPTTVDQFARGMLGGGFVWPYTDV